MGKIKMGGNATMEFESDYYEFHITVSVISGNSGDAVSRGRRRTEQILKLLQEKAGIDVKTINLENEKNDMLYNKRDGYNFKKKFCFKYKADNSITESIVSLLENMSDVEYDIDFRLENESDKEQFVMSAAVNNAKEKAEKLATALGSHITGFEEIRYEFDDEHIEDGFYGKPVLAYRSAPAESLAANLQNPKIEISKSVEIIWITD